MAVRYQQQLQEQHQDPGDPAPAAAAEAPAVEAPAGAPGKLAGGSKGKAGNRAAKPTKTLEQRSALADRALARIATGDEPKAEEKPAAAKPAAKPEEKPAAADGAKPEEKPAESAVELSDVAKAAIATLLKAGKLHDLAALAGVDAKSVDASNAKLRLVRERDDAATTKETKAINLVAEAKSLRDECKKEFGDPHKARKAVDKGEWVEAVQYLEQILKVDFGTLTREVAKATKGMDPKALETWKRERELKAREDALTAKEKKTETERTEAERTAKATKTIRTKLPDHPAMKLKKGDVEVLRVLEDNFDEKTGNLGLTYTQAADRVLADFDAQALALGYTKPGAAPKTEEKPAKKTEEPAGKKPFVAPAGAATEPGKRRGSSFEERSARADRQFGRSKTL